MNAIVVTDKQWAIGRSGDLLFSLPGDMKHFRELTTGGTVIMGRKTLDSFPGGRPLPKRRNIVITRSPDFHREGCETVSTPEDALALAGDEENVWLIGGGSIYTALLGRCRRPPSPEWTAPYRMPTPFSPIWTPSLIGKLSGPARPSRKMA